jgi:Protein of unknown function (DUF1640)
MVQTMASITFDTHLLVKRLKDKGMPEEQAETVVSIMRESYNDAVNESASKSDIKQLITKEDLQKEISPMRTNLAVLMWGQGLIILTVVVPAIKHMLGL